MSSLTKRSTKLYNGLSNKQKAALTFQNLAELNADEVPIITGTVEKKHYSQRDTEYTDWIETFFSVASLWGMSYWQQKYQEAACLVLVAEQDTDQAIKRFREVEARVTALHYALQEFCNTHGLDVQSVYKFAGAEQPNLTGKLYDEFYLAEWIENLNNCIHSKLSA
ncbi:MAG: hypothetical protein GX029_03865 [Pseudomonadaceae bacterium]|nr:hypothetical protein [Pseudomonadaceae bacterium]